MIQYYRDLESQVKTIQDAHLSGGQIQKIYSTAFFVALSVRITGKTHALYFGRGSGMEGVWLGDALPAAGLRRKDNFLEYLRRHLSACTFLGLELDRYDRIIRLDYQKFGMKQSLLLFWKARKVYFVHSYRESPESQLKILMSWKSRPVTPVEETDLYSCFYEIGRRTDLKHDVRSPKFPSIDELLIQEEQAAAMKSGQFKPDFLERKKLRIEEDLGKARQWEKIQDVLNRDQSLEKIYELKVGDHRIKFEGELNAYERRNLLFEKIKKLKKGETILKERLGDVTKSLEEKKKPAQVQSGLPLTKIAWGENPEALTLKEKPREEGDEFRIFQLDHFQVGVGKTARGNDQLRSKWAGKEDLWLHLDGHKSAHAIIRMNAGVPGNEQINLAASILARFSHFQSDWIPVIYTQVKNLKGVSGVAGMVTYKKEKHLRCPAVDVSHLVGE